MRDTSPAFVVRPGIAADAEAIAAIYVETWRATYPGMLPDNVLVRMSNEAQARYWARLLSHSRGTEIVQVAARATAGRGDGAVVGFGSAGIGRHARRSGATHEGEIFTLYVRPDWQNRGVGRRLICALLGDLRAQGCTEAMLWVLAENPSRFFYEAMGGRRTYERVEKLWGKNVPQIGYRWPDLAKTFAEGGPCAN